MLSVFKIKKSCIIGLLESINLSSEQNSVVQPTCRTTGLLQSLDDGLVGLYADLHLCPRCLVRCAGQFGLGLLQVGLSSLETEAQMCHGEERNCEAKYPVNHTRNSRNQGRSSTHPEILSRSGVSIARMSNNSKVGSKTSGKIPTAS